MERDQQYAACAIVDVPEAGDDGRHACSYEGTGEAEHTFPATNPAGARSTGSQHDELGAIEVHFRNFMCKETACRLAHAGKE